MFHMLDIKWLIENIECGHATDLYKNKSYHLRIRAANVNNKIRIKALSELPFIVATYV
jgi:hypothetical protein